MQKADLSDEEWHEVLQEFRSEVVLYGYGDWDAAMARWWQELPCRTEMEVDAEAIRADPHRRLRDYIAAFANHLNVLTPASMSWAYGKLGALLSDQEGQAVGHAVLETTDGREIAILGQEGHVALIEFLDRFLREIDGEDTGLFLERL